jgi:hypothetical protein
VPGSRVRANAAGNFLRAPRGRQAKTRPSEPIRRSGEAVGCFGMCPVPLFPPRPSASDRFGWERVGLRRAPFGSDFGLRRAPFGSDFGELSRVEPQGRRQSSRVRAPFQPSPVPSPVPSPAQSRPQPSPVPVPVPSRPVPVPSRPVPVPSQSRPVPSADAASTGPKSARRAGDPLLLLKKGSPPRRCPAGIAISSPAGILSPPASRAEIRWQNLPPFRAPLPTGCSAHRGPALRRGLDLGPALRRGLDPPDLRHPRR